MNGSPCLCPDTNSCNVGVKYVIYDYNQLQNDPYTQKPCSSS